MASNTTYNPDVFPLEQSKLQGNGQGVFASCAANTTTNLDISLADDSIITGLELITAGATPGDYIELKVLAGANIVGIPVPGPWYVQADGALDFRLEFPMKLVTGLTLRAIYHATVILVTPRVAINYKLWKVLV